MVVSAASRVTAWVVVRVGRSTSVPSLVILSTRTWRPCRPWSARVAYASAMSRTLALAVPRAMEGEAVRSGVSAGMPRATAVARTFAGPTSWAIWAYTALTDLSVAARTVMSP